MVNSMKAAALPASFGPSGPPRNGRRTAPATNLAWFSGVVSVWLTVSCSPHPTRMSRILSSVSIEALRRCVGSTVSSSVSPIRSYPTTRATLFGQIGRHRNVKVLCHGATASTTGSSSWRARPKAERFRRPGRHASPFRDREIQSAQGVADFGRETAPCPAGASHRCTTYRPKRAG